MKGSKWVPFIRAPLAVKRLSHDPARRAIRYAFSNELQDRYKSVINQDGWETDNYLANPVVLWAHNLTFGEQRPPVGQTLEFGVFNRGKKIGKRLEGLVSFDGSADGDEFAEMLYRKASKEPPSIRAVSVGWDPLEIQSPYNTDPDEWSALDLPAGTQRYYVRNELLEVSLVAVPGNPGALKQDLAEIEEIGREMGLSKGQMSLCVRAYTGGAAGTTELALQIAELQEQVRQLRTRLAPQEAEVEQEKDKIESIDYASRMVDSRLVEELTTARKRLVERLTDGK